MAFVLCLDTAVNLCLESSPFLWASGDLLLICNECTGLTAPGILTCLCSHSQSQAPFV